MKNLNHKNEIPSVYLSHSEIGWSLMKDGMPLCAHTSKENAEKLATQYKLVLPSIFWQGEQGQFVSH